jgi:hypothetical protein
MKTPNPAYDIPLNRAWLSGDETLNTFALRSAGPVFADIRPTPPTWVLVLSSPVETGRRVN